MTNEMKSVLASRTVWAGIISVAAGFAQVYGYEFTADTQANLLNLVTGLVGCAGGVGAVLGRIAAKKRIY